MTVDPVDVIGGTLVAVGAPVLVVAMALYVRSTRAVRTALKRLHRARRARAARRAEVSDMLTREDLRDVPGRGFRLDAARTYADVVPVRLPEPRGGIVRGGRTVPRTAPPAPNPLDGRDLDAWQALHGI